MDQYTRETIQRFKSDWKRYDDLKNQIKELEREASRVGTRLGAYERILKDSIGGDAFNKLTRELESVSTSPSTTKQASYIDSVSDRNADDLSITDIILKAIVESGDKGMTAAQVFEAVQSVGIGIEKRNTVYGTLSRLNTSNRIKKVGKRYFSTQN